MSDRCSTPGGRGQDDYDYDDGDHEDICVMTSMVIMLNYSEDTWSTKGVDEVGQRQRQRNWRDHDKTRTMTMTMTIAATYNVTRPTF